MRAKDAGFEVIYQGIRLTPEQIVASALEEDVDAIGLSIHSGSHMTLVPRITELLRQRGAGTCRWSWAASFPTPTAPQLQAWASRASTRRARRR